jgi:hypothetical protein
MCGINRRNNQQILFRRQATGAVRRSNGKMFESSTQPQPLTNPSRLPICIGLWRTGARMVQLRTPRRSSGDSSPFSERFVPDILTGWVATIQTKYRNDTLPIRQLQMGQQFSCSTGSNTDEMTWEISVLLSIVEARSSFFGSLTTITGVSLGLPRGELIASRADRTIVMLSRPR